MFVKDLCLCTRTRTATFLSVVHKVVNLAVCLSLTQYSYSIWLQAKIKGILLF